MSGLLEVEILGTVHKVPMKIDGDLENDGILHYRASDGKVVNMSVDTELDEESSNVVANSAVANAIAIDKIKVNDVEQEIVEKTVNITVPTQASDVDALPDSTKYGASLVVSINSSTYVMTVQLKDQDGNNLGNAQTVDLPLESVVVSGSYDSTNKKIVLTLQNGNTIEIPVGDLISGLQTEITAQNKLSADLVDDTNSTNKFVTATEKAKIGEKKIFYCTYGTTTYQQITDALTAGKLPVCIYNDRVYSLASYTSSVYRFSSAQSDYIRYITVDDSDVWTTSAYNLQLVSNKVTSLSSDSTNNQYPSAKAVYDLVQSGVPYLTTAPSSANTNGNLIFVVLTAEPATRYAGYLYIITSSNS